MEEVTAHHHFHFGEFGNEVLHSLKHLSLTGERIMATLAEVQAGLDKLTADVATEAAEEKTRADAASASIKDLTDQVIILQAQIVRGSTVTAADLDAVLANITAIDGKVQSIVTLPTAP